MKDKNKKTISTIISKTLIFVFVVALVSLFKGIFGEENSIVGVTSIVLMLVLLKRDLTRTPIRNTVYLIAFNLMLGIGAFVSIQNLWIGLIVNFSIMFTIGYLFSYELRGSVNMMFGLHYILMLTSPVTLDQLPMRLLGLVFGILMIMTVQMIVNRNKLTKSSEKMIQDINNNILEKVYLLKNNQSILEVNTTIDKKINELKMTIYDSGRHKFVVSRYGRKVTNIIACIERLNIILDNVHEQSLSVELLNDIYIQLDNLIENKFDSKNIELFAYKHKKENIKIVTELETIFKVLNNQTTKLKNLSEKEENIESKEDIPEEFKNINIEKRHFKIKSNRVAYGIRLGLLVSLATFITNYFNLEYGSWIIYTVFALTQPYEEYTKIKSKKRIIGTIIGSLIVLVLFNLIKDPMIRTLILIANGYLMSYVSDYRNIVIFVTISAICSAAINVPSPNIIILNRIVYVMIGIVFALVANRFIFRRRYEDEKAKLNKMQIDIVKRLEKEISDNKNCNKNIIKNLFLIIGFVETRAEVLNLNIEKKILYKNKVLVNESYYNHITNNLDYQK
ncbi:FUSC family protein [Romboutsia sp.]|uniref:FUSC family protein n=1 Tax=Romboutsia sp. TaxID=1965302 RepID=UPI003F3A0E6F